MVGVSESSVQAPPVELCQIHFAVLPIAVQAGQYPGCGTNQQKHGEFLGPKRGDPKGVSFKTIDFRSNQAACHAFNYSASQLYTPYRLWIISVTQDWYVKHRFKLIN